MFGVDSDRSGVRDGTDDGHRLPAVLHTAPAAVLIIDPVSYTHLTLPTICSV